MVLILRFTLTLALSHDGRGDKSASVEFIIIKLTEYYLLCSKSQYAGCSIVSAVVRTGGD